MKSESNYRNIAIYNCIGWKRHLRLSSPTIKPTPPSPPLNYPYVPHLSKKPPRMVTQPFPWEACSNALQPFEEHFAQYPV